MLGVSRTKKYDDKKKCTDNCFENAVKCLKDKKECDVSCSKIYMVTLKKCVV